MKKDKEKLPKIPNKETIEAMKEPKDNLREVNNINDLFEQLED